MSDLVQQGMPKSGTPIMNPDGTMNLAWYRFFTSLWVKSGLGPSFNPDNPNRIGVPSSANRVVSSTLYHGGPNAVVGYYSQGAIHELNVYDVQTGQFIGKINFSTWLGP